MKTHDADQMNDDLRPQYDVKALLKTAKPNPYAEWYAAGTNLVLLAPDVAEAFKDAEAVNAALRLVMKLARLPDSQWRGPTAPPTQAS
jgi:hypothetical protein